MFLVGTSSGSQKCIAIDVCDEDLVELDEEFLLTAYSPDPNVTITNNATIIILNSDGK